MNPPTLTDELPGYFRFRAGILRPVLQRLEGVEWVDVPSRQIQPGEFCMVPVEHEIAQRHLLADLEARVAKYDKRAAVQRASREKRATRVDTQG